VAAEPVSVQAEAKRLATPIEHPELLRSPGLGILVFVVVIEELFVVFVELGVVELVIVFFALELYFFFLIAGVLLGFATRMRRQDLFLEKRFDPAAQFHFEDSFDRKRLRTG
jgi:hypothetical protein